MKRRPELSLRRYRSSANKQARNTKMTAQSTRKTMRNDGMGNAAAREVMMMNAMNNPKVTQTVPASGLVTVSGPTSFWSRGIRRLILPQIVGCCFLVSLGCFETFGGLGIDGSFSPDGRGVPILISVGIFAWSIALDVNSINSTPRYMRSRVSNPKVSFLTQRQRNCN